MQSIKELFKNGNNRIWVYLGDDRELKEKFVSDVNTFADCNLSADSCGDIMAVRASGEVTHVSYRVWCTSSSENAHFLRGEPPVRIDYRKFLLGEQDYAL